MTFLDLMFLGLQFVFGLSMLAICLLMGGAFVWSVWSIGKELWRLLW